MTARSFTAGERMKEEKATVSMPMEELLKRIGRPTLIDISSEGTVTGVMLVSDRSRQECRDGKAVREKSS
jgi:hypothetical protein